MSGTITSSVIQRTRSLSQRLGFYREKLSYDALASLLRVLGASVLVASVSIFLFRGWTSGNDVERYLLLLAHTGLLTAAGFASSRLLQENKGARLFLVLALFSVAANFAVLGGLLYSQLPWDGVPAVYPEFARWQAGSPAAALTISALAVPVLGVVSWIGFRALGRRSAATLTGLYMVSNAALLVPLRDSNSAVLLVVLLGSGILWPVIRLGRADPTLYTREGRFARAMLMVPLMILVGRGFYLYAANEFMFTVVWAMAFIVLRQIALEFDRGRKLRTVLERLAVGPAAMIAFGVTLLCEGLAWTSDAMFLPLFAVTFAALLFEISFRAANGGGAYRRWALLVVCGAMLLDLVIFNDSGTAALCLVSGVAVLVYGYSVQQQITFAAGVLLALSGFAVQLGRLAALFDLGSWETLIAFGIVAIVAASIVERHGLVLRARTVQYFKRFRGWNY